jgi:hypothetical protein
MTEPSAEIPKGKAWRGWLWIALLLALSAYIVWRVAVAW